MLLRILFGLKWGLEIPFFFGWICGIRMAFFLRNMGLDLYMMLVVRLMPSFPRLFGTMSGIGLLRDQMSWCASKVSSLLCLWVILIRYFGVFHNSGKYQCSGTWDYIRNKRALVPWWKLIWFPLAIPKQAFILWLAIQNRLVTGERMASWGFNGDVLCVFCRSCIEGRDHLFFQCSFSRRIWKSVMDRCLIAGFLDDWEEIIARGVQDWKERACSLFWLGFV
jgi:hypothetical protein